MVRFSRLGQEKLPDAACPETPYGINKSPSIESLRRAGESFGGSVRSACGRKNRPIRPPAPKPPTAYRSPIKKPSERRVEIARGILYRTRSGSDLSGRGDEPPYQSRSDCGAFRFVRYSCPNKSGSPLYRFFGAIPIRQWAPTAHCRTRLRLAPVPREPPVFKE